MFNQLPQDLGRLRLRVLRPGDLEAFHAYRSDAAVARYQGWHPMSMAEASDYLQTQSTLSPYVPGTWRQLAIADTATDLLVGDLGVWLSPNLLKAEFGISITPAAQGHGYGTESVMGLIALLFSQSPVLEIEASTDTRNLPCLSALERAGMLQVETRQALYKGETCTERVFSIRKAGP